MNQDEITAVKKAAEKMRKQESAQDEIIEMARQAGLYQDINVSFHQALRNFYDLATAKERANNALLCYEQRKNWDALACADAIRTGTRARGEQA
jgi:hypothetical protein